MSKRIFADQPYLPIQGINPDANGLAVALDQSIFSKNLRYKRDRLELRGGDRRLTSNPPSGDPIIHFHRYKKPNGTEILFGFTKNAIYKYNEGTNTWGVGSEFELIDDCEAILSWATDFDSGPIARPGGVEGSYYMLTNTRHYNQLGTGKVVISKSGTGMGTWDLSDYTHLSFFVTWMSDTPLNVTCSFYSNLGFTGLVGSFPLTLALNYPNFQEIVYALPVPADWSVIRSWNMVIADDTAAIEWNEGTFGIDYITAQTRTANDIESWSTTDIQDTTEGLTVVAAGSLPPKANAAEDDGAKRELWFYDVSEEYFAPLDINRRIYVSEEDTGKTGPSVASIVSDTTIPNQMTSGEVIVAGSFEIYSAELGTLASSSAIPDSGGTDKYALIPVDDTKIKEGSNSWVGEDGKWSLEFLGADFSGLKLYILYTYEESSGYKPRFVWNFHNRLVMGNLWDGTSYYPWQIRWCAIGNIRRITDTDYSDLVDNDASPITGGVYQGYALTILKGDSIVKGTYIGGDLPFSFDTAWKSGTYAGKTAQVNNDILYFLGIDDVYCWDGAQCRSITQQQRALTIQERQDTTGYRIREYLFNALNYDKLNNCHACFYPKFNEYWLWFVRAGETYPSSVLVYNTFVDVWYYFKFPATISTGFFHTESKTTIDELVGTIDEQNWTFNSAVLEGLDVALVLGYASGDTFLVDETITTEGGYTGPDDVWVPGTALDWYLITRDFTAGELAYTDRFQKLEMEIKGAQTTVGTSVNYNLDPDSFEQKTILTPVQTFSKLRYFPDRVASHIRYLLEGTGSVAIRWMQGYSIREVLWNE